MNILLLNVNIINMERYPFLTIQMAEIKSLCATYAISNVNNSNPMFIIVKALWQTKRKSF